jgi:hypothetical protein
VKSCLNCISSGYFAESHAGVYSYEGGCNDYGRAFNPPHPVWHIYHDDLEELKEAVNPLFEAVANNCEHYKPTGKPE